ncbi:MAG: SGNH/GDSL hydrolase family protein [Opitutaceae bacterium]
MRPASAGLGLLIASFAIRAAAVPVSLSVPASDPAIVYEGRTASGPDGSVRMGFPGVTVHLRFRGESLAMRTRATLGPLYFDASVDGAPYRRVRIEAAEGVTPVATGLAPGPHTLELVRLNESFQGVCTLEGFELGPAGALLRPPALPARKLMFIGDSITCGEMIGYRPGRSLEEAQVPENSDARLSYGMLLARRLGAQCNLVSYGGRGVIRDWQGIQATNNAPQFYELALPDDPASLWDAARHVPDAIVFALGQNDFSSGIPDETEFVNAYVEFVRRVHADAPHAFIFLMDSPMLDDDGAHGPRRSVLRFYLRQIAAKLHDPRVALAPVRYTSGVPGNGHPTGRDHVAMADELEPLLRRALGW